MVDTETVLIPRTDQSSPVKFKIFRSVKDGIRYIHVVNDDCRTVMALDAAGMHILAIALYGASENWEKPPTKAEIETAANTLEPGDLVEIDGVQGGYDFDDKEGCLVWRISHIPGEIVVAIGPGRELRNIHSAEARIIKKCFRPRHWFR